MFDSNRYEAAIKTLETFQKSSSTCIELLLTEKETAKLERKFKFRNLAFGFNPIENAESSKLKKYVVIKTR